MKDYHSSVRQLVRTKYNILLHLCIFQGGASALSCVHS